MALCCCACLLLSFAHCKNIGGLTGFPEVDQWSDFGYFWLSGTNGKMSSQEAGSLRQLINARLDALAADLKAIRLLLEMPEKPVRPYEFEGLKLQVAQFAEALQELEARVVQLEQHTSRTAWIFRQAITIILGLLIAYLIGVLR